MNAVIFTSLASMLADGVNAITLSVSGNKDALTVVVNRIKAGSNVPALNLTGSAAELDEQFARLLGNYREAVTSLDDQLAATKATIEAANAAAKKEAEDKAKARKSAKPNQPATPSCGCESDGESGHGDDDVISSDSLFD